VPGFFRIASARQWERHRRPLHSEAQRHRRGLAPPRHAAGTLMKSAAVPIPALEASWHEQGVA